MFHQRWMPSNQAKNRWIDRVRGLDIEFLCPQHGRIFKGDEINPASLRDTQEERLPVPILVEY